MDLYCPALAVVSHCWPWLAVVSHRGPALAFVGCRGPVLACVGAREGAGVVSSEGCGGGKHVAVDYVY